MDDNAQKFRNNPFAHLKLEKTAFGTGVAPRPASAVRKHKQKKPKNAVPVDVQDAEDSALFLQTMTRGAMLGKGSKKNGGRGGFALEDQVDIAQKLAEASEDMTMQEALAQETDAPAAPVVPLKPAAAAGTSSGGALHSHRQDVKSFESFLQQPENSDKDGDAFLHAMGGVTPLAGKGRDVPPPVATGQSPDAQALSMQEYMESKFEFALSLTGEYMEGYVVGLDELTMNKLRAGQFSPEAHIDLHGLNAMQAYETLVGFFRSAWYKGLRVVLVVPGRGKNSPDGVGILRDKLQLWLTQEPFKRVVLAFCTARPTDGGFGGVYVMLRKMRKKGKIYWERMPADPDLF